jgi:hypothetical protein
MNFPESTARLVEALDGIVARSKGQLTDEEYAVIDLAAQVVENTAKDKDVRDAVETVKVNW